MPAIPALAKSFHVSFGVASLVVTMFLIGNLLGTIPSGWLIDRFGRRPVLIAGPLLAASMGFLVAGANSFPELLALRFINGFAAQMWIMSRLAAISHGAAASQRGRLVSWMFGMDSTGRLAGPVIGGFIANEIGARVPFLVYASLALVALIPTVLFAKDTPRDRSRMTGTGAKPATRKAVVTRDRDAAHAVLHGRALCRAHARPAASGSPISLRGVRVYARAARPIGYLATSATSLISLPIGFLAGWMMDRFGRKRTMVPGFTGVAVSMLALALTAFFHLSLSWYVVLFLIGVALQALTGGSVQTIGTDVAPPEARGTFLGIWRFAGQGGQALSPLMFALLADQLNYGSAFLFIALSASTVAYLLIRYIPETRTAA